MALLNQTVQVAGKLGSLFEKLREGQAPAKFTREFLKDLGFMSSNWHATISLLKGLGFLSADGAPTARYMDFLDGTRWKHVLAEAVRAAYSDIFVMKKQPTRSDKSMIVGKYKSTYNMSELVADRAAATFLALLELVGTNALQMDTENSKPVQPDSEGDERREAPMQEKKASAEVVVRQPVPVSLSYNIQIHLPATKDVEVYNAIFKSLREHVID